MANDFKILFAGVLTGSGPVVIVEIPPEFYRVLPAQATVLVDGVEVQKIEIRSARLVAYGSVEASKEGRNKKGFQISEAIEQNEGRDWRLRFDD